LNVPVIVRTAKYAIPTLATTSGMRRGMFY
jgi:hypothetical protein